MIRIEKKNNNENINFNEKNPVKNIVKPTNQLKNFNNNNNNKNQDNLKFNFKKLILPSKSGILIGKVSERNSDEENFSIVKMKI